MRLYIEGPVNKYYVQTLCMIFFPGTKFSDDEAVTPETPQLWVTMNTDDETVTVDARMVYAGQEAAVQRTRTYLATASFI